MMKLSNDPSSVTSEANNKKKTKDDVRSFKTIWNYDRAQDDFPNDLLPLEAFEEEYQLKPRLVSKTNSSL